MNCKHQFKIGRPGRWAVFAGVPYTGMALAAVAQNALEKFVGQQAFPYVSVAIIALCFVISMIAYGKIPKNIVIPIGLAGWIVTFCLLYWYFWFGPGALKM